MQKRWLAGVAAAALISAFAGTAVIAQQAGSPRGAGPPQAGTSESAGRETPRRSGRWFDFDADDREQDLRLFEDYASDQDEPGSAGQSPQTGQGAETGQRDAPERWGGGGRGEGRGDRPRRRMHGMMMGPHMLFACAPQAGRIIERRLAMLERIASPTDAQRESFERLKQAMMRAREIAVAGCPSQRPMTPPGRLAAVETRLQAMLEAVRVLRPAVDEFFGMLNEEQKARVYSAMARAHMRHERRRAWRERHGGPHHGGWRGRDGRGYGGGHHYHHGRGYGRGDDYERGRGRYDDDRDDDDDDTDGRSRSGGQGGGRDLDRDGWPDPWGGRM